MVEKKEENVCFWILYLNFKKKSDGNLTAKLFPATYFTDKKASILIP